MQRSLGRLLLFPEWASGPGMVAFVWCVADLVIFAVLWFSGDRGAGGPLAEIGLWIPISLVIPRLLRRPLNAVQFADAVVLFSLIEEAIAFQTGGGLHGTATSLAEDWVRSVPTFLGLGLGLLASVRLVGLSPPECFAAAAAAGVVIEVGLGAGFNPIALVAVGGAAAWVYGTILALPIARRPRAPAGPWARAGATTGLLAAGAIGGGLVGLALQGVLHL
jgi:hypothetical protein